MKHIPLSSFVFSLLRFTWCHFSVFFLFHFSFPFSKLTFFFFSLSSHKTLQAVHVIRYAIHCISFNFSFRCFWSMQNFLQGRNVLSLSLLSDTESMAVLVQGFSSRALGVISATSTSNTYIIVFSLCSCSKLVDSASLHGPTIQSTIWKIRCSGAFHSELFSGEGRTIPCVIFCQNFACATLGLLSSNTFSVI